MRLHCTYRFLYTLPLLEEIIRWKTLNFSISQERFGLLMVKFKNQGILTNRLSFDIRCMCVGFS